MMAIAGYSSLLAEPQQRAKPKPSAQGVVKKYCVACHSSKLKTGSIELETVDAARPADHPTLWEKVARKFRTGEMPPPGLPRPDKATYAAVTAELETALDAAAAINPKPGRVAVHRMNRAEYTAAVRDLLGVEADARKILSTDESDQEGFDNLASVLSVSPALLENYLSAARVISRIAIGDTTIHPVVDTWKYSKTLFQDHRMSDELPFGTHGGAVVRHHFPVDAEYNFKVLLRREEYDYIIGMGEPHVLEIRIDGALLKRFRVGGEAKGTTMPESFAGNTQGDPEFEKYMHEADLKLEVRAPVKAGSRKVQVAFVQRNWEEEGILQPPQRGFARSTNEYYYGNPAVEFIFVGGPYGDVKPGDSESRRKIFICRPETAAQERPCAQKILSNLARKAYRRPVATHEIDTLMAFYKEGRVDRTFDEGIRRGVERILAAPSFLFRIQREPAGATAGVPYRLSDFELASRLSFFIWGSLPDDKLLGAVTSGKLKSPIEIERQVRRMLRDPRSQALVNNFATRWLELNKIVGIVPDSDLFGEWDENLREAMGEETRVFVAEQLREDRSVVDLLAADYSYINERLARHYGIPNIYGNRYRKVTFPDGKRGGLLGQASVLSVTSYPNRTSVVMRGRWLLANLLGAPPPPPPSEVPALKEPGADGAPKSLRDRMQEHRANPVCASCHQRMDPLGFSLENFDALGKWRDAADGVPVDASASLPDGTKFDGITGLRQYLAANNTEFIRTLAGKLMAYGIGRGLEDTDQPAVRRVVKEAAAKDYRWSSIIVEIAKSPPFIMGTMRSAINGNLAQGKKQGELQ